MVSCPVATGHSIDIRHLAERLLRQPTAPYYETAVAAEVEKICGEHDLNVRRDRNGNLLVHLKTAADLRPLVIAAHMDHPGFHVVSQKSVRSCVALFKGGVGDPYFRVGTRVRVMPGDVPATLGRRIGNEKRFELCCQEDLAALPEFAIWDLQPFQLRGEKIYARGCDDVVGVAVVLATLIELKRARARVNLVGVLSRAEEVGFHGALALAASRRLPKNAIIISLETSRELPGVKMGNGVILRVGDRASTFHPEANRFLAEVAAATQKRDGQFRYQRALMSGGTCEATAYQHFGYTVAAACIALGNYHNCGPGNRIAAEFVNLKDACSMKRLLVEAARQMRSYRQIVGKLPERLEKLLREAREEFRVHDP